MRTRQSMREVPGWIEASPDLVEAGAESANVVAQGVRRMESGCNLRKLMPCLLILMSGPLSVYPECHRSYMCPRIACIHCNKSSVCGVPGLPGQISGKSRKGQCPKTIIRD